MAEIFIPAMDTDKEVRFQQVCDSIRDFMGAEITVQSVVSFKVNVPDDRPEIIAIFKRLGGDKTGLNSRTAPKKKIKRPKYGEDGIDPKNL